MSRFRFAIAVTLLACSTVLVAPLAAAPTESSSSQRLTESQKQKQKQKQKKAQAKQKQKPQAKAQPKAPTRAQAKAPANTQAKPLQAAGPKPGTDTESKITKPGNHTFVIQHGGLSRTYRVHVPARYSQSTPAPLLVALHGGGGNMDLQATDAYYGLISKAEREGFIAVFPNGYSKLPSSKLATWNAGNCCGGARDESVDDVGFIRKVVQNVFGQLSIDRQRIYATGMSNGGMMAYRLACEMPEVFRAVATVAGTDNTRSCSPGNPVSVLHIHAKDDSHVLFNGGAGPDAADKSRITNFTSVPSTVAKWAELNGCRSTPRRILDTAGAYCEVHSWCRGQAEVQLCVTDRGGHSWPGGKNPRGERTPSQAISATDVIWDFVSRH